MLEAIRRNAQGWGVRILFLLIILVFVFWGVGSIRSGRSGVLAFVNEEPIKITDYEDAYRRGVDTVRQQNPDLDPEALAQARFREQIFGQMVNALLLRQEARRLGLEVTPNEVRARIAGTPAFRGEAGFDRSRYVAVLGSNELSPARFEAEMQSEMLVEKLRSAVGLAVPVSEAEARQAYEFAREEVALDYVLFPWAGLAAEFAPSEARIQEHYQANQARFAVPAVASFATVVLTPRALADPAEVPAEEVAAYYEAHREEFVQPETIRARHILVKVDQDAPEAEVEAARRRLLELQVRLGQGADFEALAREQSDGPSAPRGGDLGWFPRGAMVGPFEEAAFALAPGEVGGPVRTDFGWHLIKVEERREGGVKSPEEAGPEIRTILAEERAAGTVTDLLDEVIERTVSGEDLEVVAQEKGLAVQRVGPATQPSLAQALGMEPEAAARLFALGDGETNDEPVAVPEGYVLIKKVGGRPQGIQPLEEVKPAIVEALKREEGMRLAREQAGKLLAGLADPAKAEAALGAAGASVKSTGPVGRQGFVEGLGLNPEMIEAAFAAREGAWLPEAFAVESGYVAVRLADRITPPAEAWEGEKDAWMKSMKQAKEGELFEAFLMDLRARAEVEMVAPELLKTS